MSKVEKKRIRRFITNIPLFYEKRELIKAEPKFCAVKIPGNTMTMGELIELWEKGDFTIPCDSSCTAHDLAEASVRYPPKAQENESTVTFGEFLYTLLNVTRITRDQFIADLRGHRCTLKDIRSVLYPHGHKPLDYYDLCHIAIDHQAPSPAIGDIDADALTNDEYLCICQSLVDKSPYAEAVLADMDATRLSSEQLTGLKKSLAYRRAVELFQQSIPLLYANRERILSEPRFYSVHIPHRFDSTYGASSERLPLAKVFALWDRNEFVITCPRCNGKGVVHEIHGHKRSLFDYPHDYTLKGICTVCGKGIKVHQSTNKHKYYRNMHDLERDTPCPKPLAENPVTLQELVDILQAKEDNSHVTEK
jgi:hypothetical protein